MLENCLFNPNNHYYRIISSWCKPAVMEFFLNVFTEFSKFSDKKFTITVKGLVPATSCIRDQDATTVPARHMWETGSLNWAQFMHQWLSVSPNSLNSVKVLRYLGKTPMCDLFLCKGTELLFTTAYISCPKSWFQKIIVASYTQRSFQDCRSMPI